MVLFDIDGTLLLSGGAGMRALESALREVFGVHNGMFAVRPDGKTDLQIVREALRAAGRSLDSGAGSSERFFGAYLEALRVEIRQSVFRVLPGARELVSTLSRDSRFLLGIATGNVEEGARIKLAQAGLDSYFRFGGYGSDAEDRTDLIQAAIRKGRAHLRSDPEDVIVIGDTPLDIIHGRAAGARVLAVASGSYRLEELNRHGADGVVTGLDQVTEVMKFLDEGG